MIPISQPSMPEASRVQRRALGAAVRPTLLRIDGGSGQSEVRTAIGLLLWLVVSGSGCSLTTGLTGERTTPGYERVCNPTLEQVALRKLPLSAFDRLADDELTVLAREQPPTTFTWRTVETARVIDVEPLLRKIELIEAGEPTPEMRAALAETRLQIVSRVTLAMLEVSSAVAKATCEIERTQQVVDRLRTAESARVRQQTLWAIVVGAAAAVASGGLTLAEASSTADGIVSIIGGTLAGALGITALYQEDEETFEHRDNLLREVWVAPETPEFLPPSIWRFLNRPIREETIERTYRADIVEGWRQEGRLGPVGSVGEGERTQLFFGTGGRYSTTDLFRRARMLETLRATFLLMNQDLEQLLREVTIQATLTKHSLGALPCSGDSDEVICSNTHASIHGPGRPQINVRGLARRL